MIFNDKWIEAKETNFVERAGTDGKPRYFLYSKIVPKNQISRNKVKYNWDSVLRTMDDIPGISLNHNHKFQDKNDLPRGEWKKAWIASDNGVEWLHGLAEIYNTEYNKEYIEWIKAAKNPNVSLNVSGDSQVCHSEEGIYQEAIINGWREISTVNVPGFIGATANLEVMLSESLKEAVDETTISKDEEMDPNMETEGIEIVEPEVNPAEEDEDEPLDAEYDFEQLKNGIIHELQITNDPYEAKKLAKINLDKDKDYYKKIIAENEQEKKDSVILVKEKLDIIANRRYGRNYDALLDREKSKVLFSTDIEKGTNDVISSELKQHYITKTVEDNIDKIINKSESIDDDIKEENSEIEFFEKLNDVRFFEKLKQIRRI